MKRHWIGLDPSQLRVGARVVGKGGGVLKRGTVMTAPSASGMVEVKWDDGTQDTMNANDLLLADSLQTAEGFLSRKYYGQPTYTWIALGLGAVFAVYMYHRNKKAR